MTNKSVMVAYFSHSGNTQVIANQIHEIAGGDIFKIDPIDQYPNEYNAVVEQARKELDQGFLPELKTNVENPASYNEIYLGYPNWWGTVPRPVASFLSTNELSGKTIVPFCTHEGSGLGRSVADIRKLCPGSTVMEGFAVKGGSVHTAGKDVAAWLREIGIKG